MKITRIILSLLLIAAFSLFALASNEESTTNNQGNGTVEQSEKGGESSSNSTSKNDSASVGGSELGDYSVVIDSCRLAKDYQDEDVIIVKYIYTNVNDDDPTSFYVAFEANAYQNGVGLNISYFVDDSAKYDSSNQHKEIKKGATLEVEVAYELNDTETDIEIEVKELFSFNDSVITKKFSLN